MDLPTTAPPVSTKPYTISLKNKSFIDEEIKLLEDTGCISKSLSNCTSPICIIKKKLDPSQPHKPQLCMCIAYRKVNKSLVMACNNSNGKVVSTFPLPKIQELLAQLNKCKITKVKQRQLNKFNNLLNKKEGNITRANSPNLASQAGSSSPPGKEAT